MANNYKQRGIYLQYTMGTGKTNTSLLAALILLVHKKNNMKKIIIMTLKNVENDFKTSFKRILN